MTHGPSERVHFWFESFQNLMLEGGYTTDLCPCVHLSFAIVVCDLGSCTTSIWIGVKMHFQENILNGIHSVGNFENIT